MHRHLNRFGLAILITLGVIAWTQQQTPSFSPPLLNFSSIAQAATGKQPSSDQQLLDAVKAGDRSAVQAALEQGISPNAGDINGGFALSHAAGQGNLEIMQLLLERGAEVNITADEGYTPLMEAILGQPITAVQLLLDYKADPNQLAAGMTPLGSAVTDGNLDLVKLLIVYGADVHQPSQEQSLLEMAQIQGNPEIIDLIESAQRVQR